MRDCAIHGHLSIAQMLIKNGANVDHVDNFGKTSLMYSVSGGDFVLAQLLIENGADINHTDAPEW
jgi:ankyrin repeat protein